MLGNNPDHKLFGIVYNIKNMINSKQEFNILNSVKYYQIDVDTYQ
jgi:hypothetical protein